MVEAEALNSHDEALIPMPGSSKTFFCGVLSNSAVRMRSDRRYVAFFQPQPCSLHHYSPVHAWLFLQCSGSIEQQP